jgi:hypothetical protein
VNKGDMVQRLEELLGRVRARAAQPRARSSDARVDGTATAVEPETAAAMIAAAPERSAGAPAVTERAAEEAPSSDVRGSRERLVAVDAAGAEPRGTEPHVEVRESVAPVDVAELEVLEEQEADEPPLSSRRPVVPQPEERIAQIAFGEEEPRAPLHTPPPESGKLPSADVDFDADLDVSGVRSPTPLLPRKGPEPSPRELTAEAIRPQLVPSDAVADVVAGAQAFSPSTFVALLDASLGLCQA